jgi:hypothetical protein
MFDIRTAIREVLDQTDITDPGDIAEKVAAEVPQDELRPVLTLVLRDFVRIEIGLGRARHRAEATPESETPRLEPEATGRRAKQPFNPSTKVEGIRQTAPRWLHDRVSVGDAGWKLTADCTYEDLKTLQLQRLKNAARSQAIAKWYGRLADLVRENQVDRVGDLPTDVLIAFEARTR